MHARLSALAALLALAGTSGANDMLFVSGNVMTGNTWHAAQSAGSGASGSCSVGGSVVQYYRAAFHTDTTASTYSLHLYYESFQFGFVYLYQDAFDPADPCQGIVAFGYAPVANIANIQLDANRQYFFVTSEETLYGGGGSFQVTIDGPAGSNLALGVISAHPTYCYGDGTHTFCPCANESPYGENAGCLNSLGLGTRLVDAGTASVANDTVVLQCAQMPDSSALYVQGTSMQPGGAGVVFGDGLRCVTGTVTRLGTRMNSGGASQYPDSGDAPVSVRGSVSPGDTRTYQVWYRNAASFCTTSTFNLSNGLSIAWGA